MGSFVTGAGTAAVAAAIAYFVFAALDVPSGQPDGDVSVKIENTGDFYPSSEFGAD